MTDSLASLAAFVRVADSGSFVQAAREAGLSPSALGKAVTRLEERLATRLFHRSTRHVSLTAEGSLFLDRARRILAEYEAGRAELAEAGAAPRGRLKVSLPLVGVIDADLLAQFAAAYPEVVLDLHLTDRLVDVVQEGFDVVVRTGEAEDSRLTTRLLTRFHHAVVAAPDYLAAHGAPTTPDDLTLHACLLYRFPSTGKVERWPLEEIEAAWPQPPAAISDSIETLAAMARAGLGLACLPAFAVKQDLASGRLVEVLSDDRSPPRAFRMLWPSSRRPSPKVRAFVDFMGGRFRNVSLA